MTLSVDYVMIVGKYLCSESDYVNLVRVSSRFRELLLMYKFNPISNADLFPNIETQHFYVYRDIFYRKRDMFRYVYWIKPFLLDRYFAMIDSSKCVIKDVFVNKALEYCKRMKFPIGKIHTNGLFTVLPTIKNGYVIFRYVTTYFGFEFTNGKISDCFTNEKRLSVKLILSESTILKNKRYYIRYGNFDTSIILNKVDAYTIKAELESDCKWIDLPQEFTFSDYLIIEN